MRWPFVGRQIDGQAAIALDVRGFALARARRTREGSEVLALEYAPCAAAERAFLLREAVAARGLRGARAVVALDPTSYLLRVLDAPDVPAAELRPAVRWAARDLVDFDISEAIVDCFAIPGQENRRGRSRLYAVIARPEPVREARELAQTCGLELAAIDIAELSLRNLLREHPDDTRGIALVTLREDAGLISLVRDGDLYAARWIDADLRTLYDFQDKEDPDPSSLGAESAEALLLELQRSLDYYQHELAQHPPARVLISPAASGHAALCAYLGRHLDLPVEPFKAPALGSGATLPDDFASLVALGAALRPAEMDTSCSS